MSWAAALAEPGSPAADVPGARAAGLVAGMLSLLLVVVVALLLRGPADQSHLIPDGAANRFVAKTLAEGHLTAPAAPVRESFKIPLILDVDDKRFGKEYPTYAAVLALGQRLGVEWLVNPLLCGALVLLTFLLGRELFDARIGVMAASVVAGAPAVLDLGVMYLNSALAAALFTAAAWLMARASRRGTARGAALAGFLFGAATATKPYTGALLLGLFVAVAFLRRRATPHGSRLAVAASFGLGAVPWAAAMLLWNLMLSGDPRVTPYQAWSPENRPGFGEVAGRTFTPEIATSATKRRLEDFGDRLVPLPRHGRWIAAGLLLAAVVLAGNRGRMLALAFLVIVGGYVFYWGNAVAAATMGGARYYFEALPALALLMSVPIAALLRGRHAPLLALAFTLLPVAGMAWTLPARIARMRTEHANPLTSANRDLERYLAARGGSEPAVFFVDISTYNAGAALLAGRADLRGPVVVAVYREPATNRQVLDAYPGYGAFHLRWDPGAKEFVARSYRPEDDTEGPPNAFPYNREITRRVRPSGT